MVRGLSEFLRALDEDHGLREQLDARRPEDARSFAEHAARLGRDRGYDFSPEDVQASVEVVPAEGSEVHGFALYGLRRSSMILINRPRPINPLDDRPDRGDPFSPPQ